MKVQRGILYVADLEPRRGAELGKARPVVVIQTDELNEVEYPTTWVLTCTTRLVGGNERRVPLPKGTAGNLQDCEIMIDHSRTIDNWRFVRKLGPLPESVLREVDAKLEVFNGP